MVWQALSSAIVGLVLAGAAAHWLPGRFTDRTLVLATGPAAGLLGGLIARIVIGAGHPVPTLVIAAAVSVAILSLLLGGNVRTSPFRPEVAPQPRTP
ncbi:hypothetical protein LHJ74_18680 [Streptomyces sp. N2-109]|uniref:GlsB/YeaQ/YmgE family stress response membrane protein n=1 Tax=Streptomyces gossypii TaxID=2883101 RepID=A0ABT2JVH9_9ACTN|nr:hypothetical protein [Streptomyces gossypii]MCT2591900.1 hypothetical protein [Streptomyces gossypii]